MRLRKTFIGPASSAGAGIGYDIIGGYEVDGLLNHYIDSGRYLLEQRVRVPTRSYGAIYRAIDLSPSPNPNDVDDAGVKEPVKVAVEVLPNELPTHQLINTGAFEIHGRASEVGGDGVIRLHRKVEEDGLLFIIQDLNEDNNLYEFVKESAKSRDHERVIKDIFPQMLDIMSKLHENNIFHRNLRPQNFLVGTSPSGDLRVQLQGFGMATESEQSLGPGSGSVYYMPPECNYNQRYSSSAADIWSLGTMLVNMISLRQPWEKAYLSDKAFYRYKKNRHSLMHLDPSLSEEAFQYVDHIFSSSGKTEPLARLREDFLKIQTLKATNNGHRDAHTSASSCYRMQTQSRDDIFPVRATSSSESAQLTISNSNSMSSRAILSRYPTSSSSNYSEDERTDNNSVEDNEAKNFHSVTASSPPSSFIRNGSSVTPPTSSAKDNEGTRVVPLTDSLSTGVEELSDNDSPCLGVGGNGPATPIPIISPDSETHWHAVQVATNKISDVADQEIRKCWVRRWASRLAALFARLRRRSNVTRDA